MIEMPSAHATKHPEPRRPWNVPEDTKRLHLLPEHEPSHEPDYRLTTIYISIVLTAIFLLLVVDSFLH